MKREDTMSRSEIEEIGQKIDLGKPHIDLVTPDCIIGIAEVLTKANEKYTPNSWQNVKDGINLHYSAAMRHILAWKDGEINDSETGLSHIKHAMANLMFLLYHEKKLKANKG